MFGKTKKDKDPINPVNVPEYQPPQNEFTKNSGPYQKNQAFGAQEPMRNQPFGKSEPGRNQPFGAPEHAKNQPFGAQEPRKNQLFPPEEPEPKKKSESKPKADEKKPTDPDYKGKITSKKLKDGPLEARKCTDLFCVLVFIVFWFGAGMIAINAYKDVDDVMSITYVYDQFGAPCKEETPALYFMKNITTGKFSINNTVCLDQCPPEQTSPIKCAGNYPAEDCTAIEVYPATLLFGRICYPTESVLREQLSDLLALGTGYLMKAAADLKTTWWMLFSIGVVALGCGFVYLLLLKHFSGLIIWGALLAVMIFLTAFGLVCTGNAVGMNLKDFLPSFMWEYGATLLLTIALIFFITAFILIFLVCVFRTRINLSIAVLKASTDFVDEEKTVLFLPPFFFALALIFYLLWVAIFVLIIQTNEIKALGGTPLPQINWNMRSVGMVLYYLFALLWSHSFNAALCQFIIASAVCLWYFKKSKANSGINPVWKSFKRSKNHIGSVAFGSLLIGVLSFLRALIAYLQAKLKEAPVTGSEGDKTEKARGFCLACCQCCLTCFEKHLKFLNRHAYIQVAMTGVGFCQATEDAFYLVIRNAARFGVVHGLSWIFLFIGQVFIAFSATAMGYFYITRSSKFEGKLYSPVAPTIVFALISYSIAKVIMSVYGISADTIMHCFAMDEEINDGQAAHAPEQLREFVDDHHNKKTLLSDYSK